MIFRSEDSEISAEDAKLCLDQCRDSDHFVSVIFELPKLATPKAAIKSLVPAAELVRAYAVKLVVFSTPDFSEAIRNEGLEHLFPYFIVASQNKGIQLAPEFKAMVVQLLNAILEGYDHAITTLAELRFRCEKPYLRGRGQEPAIDIAGTADFDSNAFTGTVVIGFPKDTYLALVNRLSKKNYTELDAAEQDWAGELMSIAFGQVKSVVNPGGFGLVNQIPKVMLGSQLVQVHERNQLSLIVKCVADFGEFYAELAASPKEPTS